MIKPIFIHIPKNAGMTVRHHESYARPHIIPVNENMLPANTLKSFRKAMTKNGFTHPNHYNTEHARWKDLIDKAKAHKSFAIIRNPWDRVVSRYFFAKKVIEIEKKHDKSLADISSFEAFLEERHKYGGIDYLWNRAIHGWFPAVEHVCDEEGIVQCDILRFENLNEDLCAYLNLKSMSRPRNVTNLNKGSYKDLYNPKTIQIIADWYKDDIETFGFDFDSGAKKNLWKNK